MRRGRAGAEPSRRGLHALTAVPASLALSPSCPSASREEKGVNHSLTPPSKLICAARRSPAREGFPNLVLITEASKPFQSCAWDLSNPIPPDATAWNSAAPVQHS